MSRLRLIPGTFTVNNEIEIKGIVLTKNYDYTFAKSFEYEITNDIENRLGVNVDDSLDGYLDSINLPLNELTQKKYALFLPNKRKTAFWVLSEDVKEQE